MRSGHPGGRAGLLGNDNVEVSEQTCVLETLHRPDPAVNAKFDEIAQAYRQQFNQDAVVLVRTPIKETSWRR
jgi:hypothetical protein